MRGVCVCVRVWMGLPLAIDGDEVSGSWGAHRLVFVVGMNLRSAGKDSDCRIADVGLLCQVATCSLACFLRDYRAGF